MNDTDVLSSEQCWVSAHHEDGLDGWVRARSISPRYVTIFKLQLHDNTSGIESGVAREFISPVYITARSHGVRRPRGAHSV